MEKQTENTKFIIQRYDNYITGANTKGNFLIAFNTFLTGGILTGYSKIKELVVLSSGKTLVDVLICILFSLCIMAIVLVIKAVYPFLKSGNSSIEKYHSHIFFNSVAEFHSDKTYYESLTGLSEEEFNRDLANQAFQLAKGLKNKYLFLEWAMLVVYSELFIIILTLITIIIY
ncbi:MAG: Pycsar system effector family protein [bacterium]